MARIIKVGVLTACVLAVGAWAGWGAPTNLGSGVNTTSAELDPALDAGGWNLYFASNRGGGFGGYDLWSSTYAGSSWQPASNLSNIVNSSSNERGPAVYQGTNLEVYFSSDRAGGQGNYDIWRTYNSGGVWHTPTVQTVLNSTSDDLQPYILASSPAKCYFASNRPGGFGGYDIWVSTYGSSNWTTPVNLGAGVNTSANELGPTMDTAATVLYFYSDRQGGWGNYDLYAAIPTGGTWGNAENLGSPPNSPSAEYKPGTTSAASPVFFASDRSGGTGGFDLWSTTWMEEPGVAPASLGRIKALLR